MSYTRLIRAEIRKLTSTRMPVAFLAVLAALAAITASAVIWGTDMDGSKGFISTGDDQRSLMAFAANALMISGLFGAVAVAREYGHNTVIPTFLTEPRRHRAVLAQLAAVSVGGAVIGVVGTGLTAGAVAAALPTTEFGFLVSSADLARVIGASGFTGAAGALLGGAIGAVVRNVGGAVTGAVLVLVIAPPLLIQLAGATADWVPSTLATVLSGVTSEVGTVAAAAAIVAWALVPAVIGLISVLRRDIV